MMHTTLRIPALSRAGLSLCFLVTLGCDSSPGVQPEPPATPAPIVVPSVTSVTPSVGFAETGLRISGNGFLPGALVTLGGTQATRVTISESLITAAAPTRGPGAVDVVVTNPGGQRATLPGGFVYAAASVTVTPSVVTTGGQLRVEWTTPISVSSLDWIGLFRVGGSNFDYLDYQYTSGLLSGAQDWNAPSQAGQYEFRYLLNDEYTDVGRSGPVTVGVGESAHGAGAELTRRAGRGGALRRR